MENAYVAMKNALNLKIYFVVLMIACILFCLFFPVKSARKQKKNAVFFVVCSVMLVAYLLHSVPFFREYHAKDIVVERGVYTNVLGDRKSSPSALRGVYSVTLETEAGEIGLSTAPGCKEIFLQGEHEVIAYYLPNSKILLHIELVG